MTAAIRQTILDLPASRIRAVTRHGDSVSDIVRLWVGEGDEPTPQFIRDAAAAALVRGETFYTSNRGIRPLCRRSRPT